MLFLLKLVIMLVFVCCSSTAEIKLLLLSVQFVTILQCFSPRDHQGAPVGFQKSVT